MEMRAFKENKSFRMLYMYETLNRGDTISKNELANKFSVSHKAIQRDIEDLRIYLSENHQNDISSDIVYDTRSKTYKLVKLEREWITNIEVLAIAKILLESRAFNKNELNTLIDKLMLQVTPSDRKHIENLIQDEKFNYVPPRHGKPLLEDIWKLSNYISNCEIISYTYERQNGTKRDILVKPVSIMFSEYYFYLIAYKVDSNYDYPINYRVDRITNLKTTGEKFKIPYRDKFDDGEFRKRVQFMYSGELVKLKFIFSGPSIEAILDRIPTAKIISEKEGAYTLEAEAFGNGVEMWLRTQGDNVKFL